MRTVFADTGYYIALLNPRDQYHAAAYEFTERFDGSAVTTAWVLTEVANAMSRGRNREAFLALVNDLRDDSRVYILDATRELFDAGLKLFAHRPDKEWSLTDCISMVVMERENLREALTPDHHFEQGGFIVLLSSQAH